jgi:M6 family metalloprotease-like protein
MENKMKKRLQSLLNITFLLTFQTVYSQESILPSWPCTGTASVAQEYTSSTVTLKVILVEFSDIKHRNPTQDSKSAYTFDDFENLLFSSGIYVSPNMYSPDNQQVFGSLHDYYNIMSNGNLNITGTIVNHDDNVDNVPDWIQLDYPKSYYSNLGLSSSVFYNEVVSKATSAGLNVSGLGKYVKLVIIYAGHAYRLQSDGTSSSGLCPRAEYYNNYYNISEQFASGSPYNSEHSGRTFAHIGIHAHELGHLFGFPDLYYDFNNNGKWDLMGSGNFNGPSNLGECPSPINPQLRYVSGWITLQSVTSDASYQADYNLQNPEIFKTAYSSNSSYYFLVECCRFNQTMTIGSYTCPDYNTYVPHGSATQGILVWRKSGNVSSGRLLHADGLLWDAGVDGDEGDIFPGSAGVKVLSPWSDLRDMETFTSYNWVPNTKSSINCGIEITTEGSGYYQLFIYAVS